MYKNRSMYRIEYQKKYYLKHQKEMKEYSEKWRQQIKKECLLYYGKGKISCSCCGETEKKFLVLDHINGEGNKHRRDIKRRGWSLCLWAIQNNFPPIFQILCMNCNGGKELNNGICPHKNII